MVEYDADEGSCLDREARRGSTDDVVVEDCLAARGLDVEESRAE